MTPRVTLAMPVYNGVRYVAVAIRSILDQDFNDFELIITDNASTDETEAICRQFAARDPRIRYVRNERNLGAGPNHNLGVALAKGEYLKWCACDDTMSPNYVGACVEVLDRNPDAVLAFGTTQHIDEEGRLIVGRGRRTFPQIDDASPARRFRIAVKNSYWTVDQEIFGLFRLSALRQTTLQRPYWGSDHALLKEMALLGRFIHVRDITFYNREHQERASRLSDARDRLVWQATKSRSKRAFESWRHLSHLVEIAFRHRRVAPLRTTLPTLVGFAFSPRQFSRCILEALSVVLPRPVEEGIRNVARWLFPPPSFDLVDSPVGQKK